MLTVHVVNVFFALIYHQNKDKQHSIKYDPRICVIIFFVNEKVLMNHRVEAS
jgi:hypothetical protein